MNNLRKAFFTVCVTSAAIYASPASAQCVVPNVLTNGQVADATEVMDNFNAVAACADDATEVTENTVTHTGEPSQGKIAVFSGPTSITNGNLEGDVTTSGSTATTLAPTGVVPGSYSNATLTIDDKGRITSANSGAVGGGGGTMTKYAVASSGDNFIDVQLDGDDGYAYHVIIRGQPSVDTKLNLRVSSDNGASFYSGTTDYKHQASGGATAISLSNGLNIGTNRVTIADFTLVGMNVVSTERFGLTGTIFTVQPTAASITAAIGGHNNSLAASNYNAFRIYVSQGSMDNFAVYVERKY